MSSVQLPLAQPAPKLTLSTNPPATPKNPALSPKSARAPFPPPLAPPLDPPGANLRCCCSLAQQRPRPDSDCRVQGRAAKDDRRTRSGEEARRTHHSRRGGAVHDDPSCVSCARAQLGELTILHASHSSTQKTSRSRGGKPRSASALAPAPAQAPPPPPVRAPPSLCLLSRPLADNTLGLSLSRLRPQRRDPRPVAHGSDAGAADPARLDRLGQGQGPQEEPCVAHPTARRLGSGPLTDPLMAGIARPQPSSSRCGSVTSPRRRTR